MIQRRRPKWKPKFGERIDPSAPRNRGLAAQWLLNEGGGKILDSSGRDNTGTLNGGVTWGQGRFGACLVGDGVSGEVSFANASSLAGRPGASVNMWVKSATAGFNGAAPFSTMTETAQELYPYSTGDIYLATFISGRIGPITPIVSLTSWHMLTVVANGSSWTMYQNAKQAFQTTTGQSTVSVAGLLLLCSFPGFWFWSGSVDAVSLYSRDLSPAEIQSLYLYPFAGMAQRRAVVFAPVAPTASPWQPFSIRSPPGPADAKPTWTLRSKPLAFVYPGFPPQGTTWQPFLIKQTPGLPEPDGWQQVRRATGALFLAPPPATPWQPFAVRQMPGPTEPAPVLDHPVMSAALLACLCINRVQSTHTGFGASSAQRSLAYASNVTAGDLLVAAIATEAVGSAATLAVTDTQGNSWTQAGPYVNQGLDTVSIWYTTAGSSGANTVKFTPSASVFSAVAIQEWSGGGNQDGTGSNTATSASWTTGSVSVSGSCDLIVAAFTYNQGHPDTQTAASGFTADASQSGSSTQPLFVEYRTGLGSAVSAAANNSNSRAYAALGVSFQCAGPVAPASPWQPFLIRQMPGPAEPEGWYQIRQVAGALFPGFTQGPASPWQPWAIRQMQALLEPEPWYQTRHIAGALFPGYTGPTVSPWQPFAVRQRPGPPEPEPPWTLAPKSLGFLWPGRPRRGRPPFVARVNDQGRRLERFTEQVSILLNSLTAQGYIQLVSQDPLAYQVLPGALSGPRAPTSLDDVQMGATAGCVWINTLTNQVYICASATIGAAVWRGPI